MLLKLKMTDTTKHANIYDFIGYDDANNVDTFTDDQLRRRSPNRTRIKIKFHDVVDFNLILILWSRFCAQFMGGGTFSYLSLSLAVSSTVAYFMKIIRRNIPERYHDKFRLFYLCSGTYIFVYESVTQMFFPHLMQNADSHNFTNILNNTNVDPLAIGN